MKTRTTYICEICGRESDDPEMIRQCEVVGAPETEAIPAGLIASLGPQALVYVDSCEGKGHHMIIDFMVYVPNSNPWFYPMITTPEEFRQNVPATHQDHPDFKKAISAVREQGLPVTIWDGEKAVPYTEPG